MVYIEQYYGEHGITPSYDEMREALQLRSKSSIFRLIEVLVDKGFLKKLRYRARAIEIVRRAPTPSKFAKTRREDGLDEPYAEIPLCGRIAAGLPHEALELSDEQLCVPVNMIGDDKKHYALTVRGDSMQDAGILEGDVVVVRMTRRPPEGSIAVALVDQEEATLKRFYRNKDQNIISLEAANSRYSTQTYPADRVHFLGHVVGLLRFYPR